MCVCVCVWGGGGVQTLTYMFHRKWYLFYILTIETNPFSFSEATILLVSTKVKASGQILFLNSTILGLPVKSDWLRIKSKCSAHVQKSELAGDLDLGADRKDRGLCERDFYPFVNKSPLRGHVVTDISRELC